MAKDKVAAIKLRDKDDEPSDAVVEQTPSMVDLLKHANKVNQNIEKASKEPAKPVEASKPAVAPAPAAPSGWEPPKV
jgi:hypothetical protein